MKIFMILSLLLFGSICYADRFEAPNINAAHSAMQQRANSSKRLANLSYIRSHANGRAKKQIRDAKGDSSTTIVSNGKGQKTGDNMINSVVVESGSKTGDITVIVTNSNSTLVNTK